jgi:DNA-binding HxlR family transcriptional regulator
MKPSHLHGTDCRPVAEILSRIGDKWSVMLVMELNDGTRRFSELRRTLHGISQKMLTASLRGLERDGFITRTIHPTIPPKVEYRLTELGRELAVPVRALGDGPCRTAGACSPRANGSTSERRRIPRYLSRTGEPSGKRRHPTSAISHSVRSRAHLERLRPCSGQHAAGQKVAQPQPLETSYAKTFADASRETREASVDLVPIEQSQTHVSPHQHRPRVARIGASVSASFSMRR